MKQRGPNTEAVQCAGSAASQPCDHWNDAKPFAGVRKAGIVAFRRSAQHLEIMLVTARTRPDSWIFPLGTVEPGETLQQAAARECAEESGCIVTVGAYLGQILLRKGAESEPCVFFSGEVIGERPDYEADRQRRWAALSDLSTHVPPDFAPIARAAAQALH